jgi:hypothetical protein
MAQRIRYVCVREYRDTELYTQTEIYRSIAIVSL